MKISERWLRQWVDPAVDIERLAEQLTMAGLEVDAVIDAAPDLAAIIVGRITRASTHPEADRLRVCDVDIGAATPLHIVCGAPNARMGLSVAVALVGAVLPGGTRIEAAEIRGQASEGMLCSPAELGLSGDSAGILSLDGSAVPGTPLADHLGLPDKVLDIDLTPNRGDCLSVRGVARELAVINDIQMKAPEHPDVAPTADATIDVRIDAPDLCAGYAARCVFDVDPAAATPDWMAERLRRSGIRPINLPVDIGNMLMLEIGQPMHAFDYEKLAGGLQVRRALPGEAIETLDGQHVTLATDTLVIADNDGPVAIAGMIGGLRSAVTERSTKIVFEAACFTPAAVSGQGRRYKIHTDSLHRFERGVDPALYPQAIERASTLLCELAGAGVGAVVVQPGNPVWDDDRNIVLGLTRIERLLGQAIDAADVQRALTALGMQAIPGSDTEWRVVPPSWRYDIAIEADLIEEVARIYGYDRLHGRSQGIALPSVRLPETRLPEDEVLSVLRQRGYSEAITYSFVDSALQAELTGAHTGIDLANPISEQYAQMRQTLWASLLPAWHYNSRRQHSDIRLYERGLRFELDTQHENGIAQIDTIAGVLDGNSRPLHWDVPAKAADFFDLKGDVEALLALAAREAVFVAETHPALHPGRSAAIYAGSARVGWLGQLSPDFKKLFKNKTLPYIFELDYNVIQDRQPISYTPISEQPRVRRDLAVVVADPVPVGALVTAIRTLDDALLQAVHVFDVFRPAGLETGFKSVALGLIFQDKASTLTDEVVDRKIKEIVAVLELHCDARIRGT